jgi:serine/threonine protein kinase
VTGKTIGRYRVGEQLGRGGIGEIYAADDISLDRKVAKRFCRALRNHIIARQAQHFDACHHLKAGYIFRNKFCIIQNSRLGPFALSLLLSNLHHGITGTVGVVFAIGGG